MKPMLAATLDNFDDLTYPLIASPKLDGIRCIAAADDGAPMSRKFEEIPNRHIYNIFREAHRVFPLTLLDGELMVPGKDFNGVQSIVMSRDAVSNFEHHVFDLAYANIPFRERLTELQSYKLPPWVKIVDQWEIANLMELIAAEEYCAQAGYEGIMLRNPEAGYKLGRSTLKEGALMKYKRWYDAEATIVGSVELMLNENEATKDAIGHTKRSKKKEGLVPGGTLGALKVQFFGVTFEVGSGFTDDQRAEYWSSRDQLPGRVITFKYQELSKKGVPRFPVWLGFRED
ncbi:ATP-dependent DNA ligase [Methylocystis heyeri]|uniref:ATP-dependent DNA ligase n=1 Tax=Methylocystis heyeri TaxID=391905 RepID=A0A6B8KD24_9HYPH|nr:ATP-dependent DNA ligase [Methylocystis heyeri]QGM46136.1 ATP-dependent DNA ligase [Methylocystis heyeri]